MLVTGARGFIASWLCRRLLEDGRRSTRLRELTGWRPRFSLEDGMSRTLEWYREHPEVRAPVAA